MIRAKSPQIFRVLLEVRELDQAQRFYESLLAVPGRRVGGGRVYFDCGPVLLALLDPSADGESGLSVLREALYFATPDLEGVYLRAGKLGCLSPDLIHNDPANPAGEIVVRPWGERSFYAADPSGNALCFVDAGTLFTGTPRQVDVLRSSNRRRPRAPPRVRPARPKTLPSTRKRRGTARHLNA